MIRLITYSDHKMTISANICAQSALRNNVDMVHVYDETVFTKNFKQKNSEILNNPRGAGLWLWKPYIISEELLSVAKDGDILVYSDAGVEIIENIRHIVDRMDSDIFLFGNMYNHFHWCKADVYNTINGRKFIKQKHVNQVQASVIIIKVNKYAIDFVTEWLKYCMKPHFIDDSPSEDKNHIEFREHRHDQAILTCLAYKYDIKLHWWPANYNAGVFTYDHAGYDDKYPVIFHHHRMRNEQFGNMEGMDRNLNLYFKSKGYEFRREIQ